MGLPADGLLAPLPRLHVVHRLGAPHVHDGHGRDDERVLPDHDDDHLHPLRRHPDGAAAVAVGRVHPLDGWSTVTVLEGVCVAYW